jgi:hypothetical protein
VLQANGSFPSSSKYNPCLPLHIFLQDTAIGCEHCYLPHHNKTQKQVTPLLCKTLTCNFNTDEQTIHYKTRSHQNI